MIVRLDAKIFNDYATLIDNIYGTFVTDTVSE